MTNLGASGLLIPFIVGHASQDGGAVSRIRLIKFLYLADVHWFAHRHQLATGYRWQFYHYGPYTGEAQRDIDTCVLERLIVPQTLARTDEAGEMTLYRRLGPVPDLAERFSATFEVHLTSEIRRWLLARLPEFLNYVYFDTPPMRDAKRGDYLRFEPYLFQPSPGVPDLPRGPRPTSREARRAYQLFTSTRGADRAKLPRDAIDDEEFRQAVRILDEADPGPATLRGRVHIDPDSAF